MGDALLERVRRRSFNGILGSAIGIATVGALGLDAGAKSKKKGKKNKGKAKCCPLGTARCNSSGCCPTRCCLSLGQPAGGRLGCMASAVVACCSAADGAGGCASPTVYCCPPRPEFPDGFCTSNPDPAYCATVQPGDLSSESIDVAPRMDTIG